MDDNRITIEPYPVDNAISSVSISVENFTLNAVDCWIRVLEYDANNKFLNVSRVYIPPEIYHDWGTNDDYLVEYCLDTLNFVRKPTLNINFPA